MKVFKLPMSLDLSNDPAGLKKSALNDLIKNHAISKSEDENTIYCLDDNNMPFQIFRVTPNSGLWHIA